MSEKYNGYEIIGDGTFGQNRIRSVGKGALPKRLRGSYTSVPLARRAIDFHKKVTVNGKEKRAS